MKIEITNREEYDIGVGIMGDHNFREVTPIKPLERKQVEFDEKVEHLVVSEYDDMNSFMDNENRRIAVLREIGLLPTEERPVDPNFVGTTPGNDADFGEGMPAPSESAVVSDTGTTDTTQAPATGYVDVIGQGFAEPGQPN